MPRCVPSYPPSSRGPRRRSGRSAPKARRSKPCPIASDITVTKVKIIPYLTGDESFFYLYLNSSSTSGAGYDLDDQGRLMLRPMRYFAPFEGARAERLPSTYARVEVHYEGTGIVPRAVTEGIAFLTAGYHTLGPQILANIKSERIGDYSYTGQAIFFLRRFMKTQRVRMT